MNPYIKLDRYKNINQSSWILIKKRNESNKTEINENEINENEINENEINENEINENESNENEINENESNENDNRIIPSPNNTSILYTNKDNKN